MNMLTTPNQNLTVSSLSQNIYNIKQDRGKRTPGDDEFHKIIYDLDLEAKYHLTCHMTGVK